MKLADRSVNLTLYHTDHCHLCELAVALCATVLNPEFFTLVTVDIIGDDLLIERYGSRIPVLRIDCSGAELGWPFDVEQLIGFLS